jgi:acyl-CoA reductase-like NAD-dependent aldehyde dehydrogenase
MITVKNPADGSYVGEAPEMARGEVMAAIDRTCAAFPVWSRKHTFVVANELEPAAKQFAPLLRKFA